MALERVIISGGGTGGHIYPAVAIGQEIRRRYPDCRILFVGAEGKMEMERVPKAGFEIEGLPIAGLQRRLTLKNLSFPFKLLKSMRLAKKIISRENPQVAIGVGGYASGPTLKAASSKGVVTVLQEQNSHPGLTNRLLGKKADLICTAYPDMEQHFPGHLVQLTGNPIRQDIFHLEGKHQEAAKYFGLDPDKPTLLCIGGSLGALTLNNTMRAGYQTLLDKGIQVIWQCGKYYAEELKKAIPEKEGLWMNPFIERMDLAYAMADIVVSRAGALSISEICACGKPSILVPSPNVAEDHQTKNARSLSSRDAAILIKDNESVEKTLDTAIDVFSDKERLEALANNAKNLGLPDAAAHIVDQIEKLVK